LSLFLIVYSAVRSIFMLCDTVAYFGSDYKTLAYQSIKYTFLRHVLLLKSSMLNYRDMREDS